MIDVANSNPASSGAIPGTLWPKAGPIQEVTASAYTLLSTDATIINKCVSSPTLTVTIDAALISAAQDGAIFEFKIPFGVTTGFRINSVLAPIDGNTTTLISGVTPASFGIQFKKNVINPYFIILWSPPAVSPGYWPVSGDMKIVFGGPYSVLPTNQTILCDFPAGVSNLFFTGSSLALLNNGQIFVFKIISLTTDIRITGAVIDNNVGATVISGAVALNSLTIQFEKLTNKFWII